ncbi:hypothetical protein NA56DRAFT_711047 [Hyaloscypha hepaticicola]|uniref:Uncharacterized protein n=1 Tax=Hyaloscypha hepaticicola TaxID=2082293 RepID=A0A2J6PKC4_9HELO|nr:hypothetical protein NA56DRAFT_711047 [Hyaloscypha hepaticicola]
MASKSPISTTHLTKPHSIGNTPLELQRMVYENSLELEPGLQAPTFLLVLATVPELFTEAKSIFKKINFVLTLWNSATFQALPQKELRSIRHLTIIWDTLQSVMLLPPSANPRHRALIMASIEASLETLTLDLRKENPFRYPMRCHIWINVLKSFISSAQGGIRKITVVFDVTTSTGHEETKLIQTFFIMFGIISNHRDSMKVSGLQVRVWEGDGRELLEKANNFTLAMLP